MQVLSSELERRGWSVKLAITDEVIVKGLHEEGVSACYWSGIAENLSHTDVLVVDGYDSPKQLFMHWRDKAKLMIAMDDIGDRQLYVDCVINHNIYGHQVDYSSLTSADVLAGPKYSLVNQKFVFKRSCQKGTPLEVMISFGGTDDGSLASPLAKQLLREEQIFFCHVVCSPLRTPDPLLLSLQEKYPDNFELHHGADMPALMKRCDYFLGAAGYSLIEALVADMQVYVCSTSDNQDLNVSAYSALCGRGVESYKPELLIKMLLDDIYQGRKLSINEIDGNGAKRVADYIENKLTVGNENGVSERD